MSTVILKNLSQLLTAESYTTFIVESDLNFSDGSSGNPIATIPPRITLIFQGGKISGNIRLVGNQTTIEAPIKQIFGEDIIVSGSWIMDRAYPQWFNDHAGKQGYFDKYYGNNYQSFLNSIIDCAPAINKAMKMKTVGEVFLPQGNYYVNETLVMPNGIHLVGEGEAVQTTFDNESNSYTKIGYESTRIIPYIPLSGPTNEDRPVMEINMDNDTWIAQFPLPSKVSNIIFDNHVQNPILSSEDDPTKVLFKNVFKIANKICCYAAGGCEFKNVSWLYFRRAIKWTSSDYADLKIIDTCYFSNDFNDNDKSNYPQAFEEDAYVVDFNGLGDALSMRNSLFSYNLFSEGISCFAFRLLDCHGGSISDCIINTDGLIRSCDAITFNSNHLETGAQLRIEGSKVTISNNWFEKGYRPSIVIDTIYNGSEAYSNTSYSLVDLIDNSFKFYNIAEKRPNVAGLACRYDILLKKSKASESLPIKLHISNCYRLPIANENNSNNPTGIWLCTEASAGDETTLSSIPEFNNYSYYLSRESTYLFGNKIIGTDDIEEMPDFTIKGQPNEHVIFITELGNIFANPSFRYKFTAQLIVDVKRLIAIAPKDVSLDCPFENQPYLSSDSKPQGMLITLSWQTNQRNCLLKLIRYRINNLGIVNQSYTVDTIIPLCGPIFLYDNGTSVNGFPWNRMLAGTSNNVNTFESVKFVGSNVICTTDVFPNTIYGNWKRGDKIIVIPKDSTSAHWSEYIYNGSQWLSGSV